MDTNNNNINAAVQVNHAARRGCLVARGAIVCRREF